LDLRPLAIEYVILASGQPGHAHLFAGVPDLAVKRQLGEAAQFAGFDVRTIIRPPFAPHRLGLAVRLIHPSSVEQALEILRASAAGPQRRLSTRIYSLLVYGDQDRIYKSRSEVLQAIVQGAVNAGLSEQWLIVALLNPQNAGGEKVRQIEEEQGKAAAVRYARRSYRKALAFAALNPTFQTREPSLQEIQQITRAATNANWKGRGGSTDIWGKHPRSSRIGGGWGNDSIGIPETTYT